jgi:ubiquinone/menaquinone biosynthesis C-methylase UbiE
MTGKTRTASNTGADEARLSTRYHDRQDWPDNYDYKRIKGSRLVELIEETGSRPAVAVEIGVGRGGVAATVSRHGIPVIGIDLSPEILARAYEHTRTENVRLLRASGFALPFRNGSLPLVYASQVLHLFDSASRLVLMREVHRVLRPGGHFVFDMKNVVPHIVGYLGSSAEKRHRDYPSKAEVQKLLQESGFSSIALRPGVLPLLGWTRLPNLGIVRRLTHTTFFVAARRS